MPGSTELFKLLVENLEKSAIPYAITGRTSAYPEQIGSDVDLICPEEYLSSFFDLLWELNDAGDSKLVQLLQHEDSAYYFVIAKRKKNEYKFLHPDVYSSITFKKKKVFEANYLLENSRYAKSNNGNQKSFKVLSPEKEFISYLLKKIEKHRINEKHFQHLFTQWEENSSGCYYELKRFFTPPSCDVIKKALENKSPEILKEYLNVLETELAKSQSISLRERYLDLKLKIKRIYNPTGLWITVMGPDGSGKSTIIDSLNRDMIECFRRKRYFHLFPKEPSNEKNSEVTTNPHENSPRGFISSTIKIIYFFFLYNFGFLINVKTALIRSSFIIFDRYYHDIFVDPRRYRFSNINLLTKLVAYFIPKPELFFLLDAPASVIQERKKEVSNKETERQVREYRNLFSKLDRGHIIDSAQSVRDVTLDVEDILMNYLAQRTDDRYRGNL